MMANSGGVTRRGNSFTNRMPSTKKPSYRSKGALQTQVSFHVAWTEVSFGEVVRVVGNVPILGDWNPELALPLQTSEGQFPCWTSPEPVVVDSGTRVEYKYVVVPADGSPESMPRWESRVGNREFVASGATMVIEDDDGLFRQHWQAEDAEVDDDGEAAVSGQLSRDAATMECTKVDKEERLALVRSFDELPDGAVAMEPHDTVFLVAFKLPVSVKKIRNAVWQVDDKGPQDGRNFAMRPLMEELATKKGIKVMCVGWPGVYPENRADRTALEQKLLEHNCIPVFPPCVADFEGFTKFNKEFLWPLFHDAMADFQSTIPLNFDYESWANYQLINMLYTRTVMPHVHENDIIWVHDFHLLLVPSFLSRKLHRANIGFYLHAPFPSVNSFMTIPVREELLLAMLASDLLGFQFFAYARNFFLAVKRITGLDPTHQPGGFMALDWNGRQLHIKVSHFVYPFQDTKRVVEQGTVDEKAAEVTALFPGRTLFAGMDRCDSLSGLVPKFRAFRRFLQEKPQYKGKALLIQYCFDDWSNTRLLETLKGLSDAVLETGEDGKLRITGAHGDPADICIILRHETTQRVDRLALFRAADVLLDSCVKAGLNLMPFEFITSHHDDSEKQRSGVVIVSEFSGCSRVLRGSLRANPWNTSQLVGLCESALTMPPEQKLERMMENLDYTRANNTVQWFEDFLTDLRKARKKEGFRLESLGFGAKMRQVTLAQDFTKMPIDVVLACYRNSKNRAIFLDNEGTLSPDKRNQVRQYGAVEDLASRGRPPDEHVLDCLQKLCDDPRNTVVILSGRNRQCMQEWFGSVKGVGLAAERGYYFKVPIATGMQWHCMDVHSDMSWKDDCFAIMAQFVKRTQGSFIENKGSALVWQYREADMVFGAWQARELASSLRDLVFGFDVEVMEGKGYVEVKLRGINKGVTVSTVLQKITALFGEVDFVLSIGDDRSDEDMFEAIQAIEAVQANEDAETVTDEQSTTATPPPDDETTDSTEGGRRGPGGLLPRHNSDDGAGSSSLMGRRVSCGGLKGAKSSGMTMGSKSFGGGLAGLASSGDMGSLGRNISGEIEPMMMGARKYFTCTVGRKPTAAKYYLDDVDEVSELLSNLRAQHERKQGTTKVLPSSHTWASGQPGLAGGKASRLGSMPALSSLAFQSTEQNRRQSEELDRS